MRLADLFENSLPVDVAALKQQLAAKQAQFDRLGGMSYQYADRMMPDDYEAQKSDVSCSGRARSRTRNSPP